MKIRIDYTLELTKEQIERVIKDAKNYGFDYGEPNSRVLLKRYFKSHGTSSLERRDKDDEN